MLALEGVDGKASPREPYSSCCTMSRKPVRQKSESRTFLPKEEQRREGVNEFAVVGSKVRDMSQASKCRACMVWQGVWALF